MGQFACSPAPAVAWATSLHWEVSSSLLLQTAHGTAPSPETGVACPGQAVLSWPGLSIPSAAPRSSEPAQDCSLLTKAVLEQIS